MTIYKYTDPEIRLLPKYNRVNKIILHSIKFNFSRECVLLTPTSYRNFGNISPNSEKSRIQFDLLVSEKCKLKLLPRLYYFQWNNL